MKEGRRNLCEVKKLFMKGMKEKIEPCNKIFLGKVYHIIQKVD